MMKRIVLTSVVLAVLTPFAVLGAEKVGEVVYLKGTATVQRNARPMNAEFKMTVVQGDTITTGKKSIVKILCTDDSVLTVQPESTFSISEYAYNKKQQRSQSLFKLLVGKLRAVVGRSALKITTDTAVAGVRGTVFDIWVDSATNTTYISVVEGEVEFMNIKPDISGAQLIRAGHTSSVTGDAPPVLPTTSPVTNDQSGASVSGEGQLPNAEQPQGTGTTAGSQNGGQSVTNNPLIHQTPSGYTNVGIKVVFPN